MVFCFGSIEEIKQRKTIPSASRFRTGRVKKGKVEGITKGSKGLKVEIEVDIYQGGPWTIGRTRTGRANKG